MNAMKTILLPLNNAAPTPALLDAAKLVAERFGSYLEGAFSRQVLPVIAGEGITLPGDYLTEFEQEGKQQAEEAREMFERLLAERAIPMGDLSAAPEAVCAGWTEMVGAGTEAIGEYARLFDLTVIARSIGEGGVDWKTTCESVLFESGRPLLLVSDDVPNSIGESIVVAWNGSTETARALAMSTAFLAQARRVMVLTVEGGVVPGPTADDVARHLIANGINAAAKTIEPGSGSVGQNILRYADEFGADLIIKGAYTHSRLRQLIFGGATSEIMAHATRPLLMCH
jgi:nucleotide-binding universal stress UspA family protein